MQDLSKDTTELCETATLLPPVNYVFRLYFVRCYSLSSLYSVGLERVGRILYISSALN